MASLDDRHTCFRLPCLQVGVSPNELLHGNMHPSPPAVEGFVTHTFDLDACRVKRAG
jgi:hypothetical protein